MNVLALAAALLFVGFAHAQQGGAPHKDNKLMTYPYNGGNFSDSGCVPAGNPNNGTVKAYTDAYLFDMYNDADTTRIMTSFKFKVKEFAGTKTCTLYMANEHRNSTMAMADGWAGFIKLKEMRVKYPGPANSNFAYLEFTEVNWALKSNVKHGGLVAFEFGKYIPIFENNQYNGEKLGSDGTVKWRANRGFNRGFQGYKQGRIKGEICYGLAPVFPPPLDDNVCTSAAGDDYFGFGAIPDNELPTYWQNVANAHADPNLANSPLNVSLLGFNVAANMWCYNGAATCIGFGEYNGECDYTEKACACPTRIRYGCAAEQVMAVVDMLVMGLTTSHLCPRCTPASAPNENWCDLNETLQVTPAVFQNEISETWQRPGTWNDATFTACDCTKHFEGIPIMTTGYWANFAQRPNINLDPAKISFWNNVWYYDGVSTCVGHSSLRTKSCKSSVVVCRGQGNTFGFGISQIRGVRDAVAENDGRHANCPNVDNLNL